MIMDDKSYIKLMKEELEAAWEVFQQTMKKLRQRQLAILASWERKFAENKTEEIRKKLSE